MEQDLEQIDKQAKNAIDKLKEYRLMFKRGDLSYDAVKELGMPHIDTFNKYSKALAKKMHVPYRGISLVGFLR